MHAIVFALYEMYIHLNFVFHIVTKLASVISETEMFWMSESERQNPVYFPSVIFYEGAVDKSQVCIRSQVFGMLSVSYFLSKILFLYS